MKIMVIHTTQFVATIILTILTSFKIGLATARKHCELHDLPVNVNVPNPVPNGSFTACLTNTRRKTIYLGGCSVFTLAKTGDKNVYSTANCFWEGFAQPLASRKTYCFEGLFSYGPGEYVVMAGYGLNCEPNKPLSSCQNNKHTAQSCPISIQ